MNCVQRLCEELEYSELLDRVVEINDPFDRMVTRSLTAVWSQVVDSYLWEVNICL